MSWQLPGPAEPGQPQPDPYASAPEQSAAHQPPAYGQPPTYPQAAPGQPGFAPWAPQPTVVKHRPWSTVLVWTIAANGAISVIVAAVVLSVPEALEYFVGAAGPGVDESLFRGMMVVAAVIGMVIIAAMLTWAVVARRRADTGQFGALKGLAITVLVFGGFGALGVLSALAQGQPPTGIVGTVLYIFAGVKVLQALKPRPVYSLGG